MKFLDEVYKKNKVLDDIFIKLFEDKDMFKKNKLELLVEIGELANETKCFKYWSNKTPNKDLVLEEYADCIIMTLYLHNYYNLELEDIEYNRITDINDQFAYLYKLSTDLYFNDNKETIREILFNLLNLATLLNISKDEIIESTLMKINKETTRLLGDN